MENNELWLKICDFTINQNTTKEALIKVLVDNNINYTEKENYIEVDTNKGLNIMGVNLNKLSFSFCDNRKISKIYIYLHYNQENTKYNNSLDLSSEMWLENNYGKIYKKNFNEIIYQFKDGSIILNTDTRESQPFYITFIFNQ